VLAYLLSGGLTWQADVPGHTVMEALASLLGVIVGAMAMVRYYARREKMFYYIGIGFLGVGLLDGYQAVITSEFLVTYSPSDLSALTGWSWIVSRQFLALLLLLSWVGWLREERHEAPERISERTLLSFAVIFMVGSVVVLTLVPLPRFYFPELLVSRPEEFIPALFLLMAAIGYIYKGKWHYDVFEHWLIVSLILGVAGQALFMAGSQTLFDLDFNVAHVLKLMSYLGVLVGLVLSMEVDTAARLRAVMDNIGDGIVTFDRGARVLSINPAVRRIFGRLESELVGHEFTELLAASPEREAVGALISSTSRGWRNKDSHVTEIDGVKLSGDNFPMELALTRLDYASGPIFVAALRDISERKEMDRVKSEFIATVSHELRTPLTVILGYLPLLSDPKDMPEAAVVARLAKNMKHSGEHLLSLVTDLLDISRIESGRMTLQRVPLSIQNVVDSVVGIMDEQATEKGLKLRVEAADGIVHGDETRLRQILINLIGNAVKFTDKGEVSISAAVNPRGVTFTITDTGMGVPLDQLDKIFDRFRQVDGSATRKEGGTGLGLAITRSLVELHGGTISATSSFGNGTKFVFDIPELV
jgi:PAS domain S-box-containing protein